MSELPTIDVALTGDNIDSVVSAVAAVIKPQWNRTDIKTEILQAGILNITVLSRVRSSHDQFDAIIIKTACEYFCGPIDENKVVCRFLNKQNLGPRILAFINNGMCMELVRGEMLRWNDKRLHEENVWKKIAEEMARWHRRNVLKAAIEHGVRRTHNLFGKAINRYDETFTIPELEAQSHLFPTQQQLLEEEKHIRELLLARGDLEEAFCHMDINGSNVSIFQEKATDEARYKHGIQLVDFDFTGICYSQIDIAWFFLTFIVIEAPTMDVLPDKNYQNNFLRHYLHHRRELETGPVVTEAEVDNLYQQVHQAKLIILLRLTMSGPSVLGHKGFNGFIQFSRERWRDYQKLKAEVFAVLNKAK